MLFFFADARRTWATRYRVSRLRGRELRLMPMRPKKICNHPGCSTLTDRTYCEKHRQTVRRHYDQQRGTPAERGYGYRWRKYREQFLIDHPICEKCWVKPTSDVDHIIAVNGPDDPLFWEPSNHQARCHSCHSRKTASENGGFGNARKP